MNNDQDPNLESSENADDSAIDPASDLVAQTALVQHLRAIQLGAANEYSAEPNRSASLRDRLIYDCGFAAGVESVSPSLLLRLQKYQRLAVAAAFIALLFGGIAWQKSAKLNAYALQQQQSQLNNDGANSGSQSNSSNDTRPLDMPSRSTKELAAALMAAQDRPNRGNRESQPLTPHAMTIDVIDAIEPSTIPAAGVPEPMPSANPLRSKDFRSLLNLGV